MTFNHKFGDASLEKMMKPILVALLATGCSLSPARADTISLNLNDPIQTISPGGMLSFSATIAASAGNTGAVYLNGDSPNVTAPFAIAIDDTPYLTNFPLLLNPGDSVSAILFDASVPMDEPAGSYNGIFALLGGTDAEAQKIIASTTFTVDVTSPSGTSVPEPGETPLILTGVLGIAAQLLRRRCRHRIAFLR